MAFFDNLKEKVADLAQAGVAKSKQLAEIAKLKAANMADMMKIPVLGLVENMSYVKCPDCGKEIYVFGESHIGEVATKFG